MKEIMKGIKEFMASLIEAFNNTEIDEHELCENWNKIHLGIQ